MVPSRFLLAKRRLLLVLLVALGLSAVPSAQAADERTGRLLVMLDDGAQSPVDSQISRMNLRQSGEQVSEIGLVTVKPTAGQSIAQAAEALRALPGVKSVSAERRYEMRFVPNDPALVAPETAAGTPPGTPMQWWVARENLYAAWDITRGAGAKVAIIDSGFDGNHPDLAGKVANALDFEDVPPTTGPADFDLNGHGTHVSSMACGAGNNALGIVGAGLDCKLIVAKTDFTDSSIARSLVQSTDLGADAISMSFGSSGKFPATAPIVEGVNYALRHNVVLVAAAANEPVEEQGDPANLLQPTGSGPNINSNRGLSVTSADFNGARTSFAGRGTQISIAGFGNFQNGAGTGPPGILGAFPANPTEIDVGSPSLDPALNVSPCGCRGTDSRFAYLRGTSMATPQVAAIAAMVGHFNPDLPSSEVIRIIKVTATRAPGTGWNPELGWGIINAGNALAVARVADRTRPKSKAKGPKGVRRSRKLTLKWTGGERTHPGLIPSGVAKYQVYRSTNGGKYKRIATTTKKSKKLTLKRGKRYRFYTVAIDKAGNRERKPSRADVSFRVAR